MDLQTALLTALLVVAAGLIVMGTAMFSTAAALIVSGVLLLAFLYDR